MPRSARFVLKNFPHHITQRGNYRQKVFYSQKDYKTYLSLIAEYSSKYHMNVLAYCLMPNHVHLIAVPETEDSFALTLRVCHMRYAQYIHARKKLKGHLWQERFFSCTLGEAHLYSAIRYVENNPVRSKLVKEPSEWLWSSARDHLGLGKGFLKISTISNNLLEIENWAAYLKKEEDQNVDAIRLHTQKGKPLMSPSMIEQLEKQHGRSLSLTTPGRPRIK